MDQLSRCRFDHDRLASAVRFLLDHAPRLPGLSYESTSPVGCLRHEDGTVSPSSADWEENKHRTNAIQYTYDFNRLKTFHLYSALPIIQQIRSCSEGLFNLFTGLSQSHNCLTMIIEMYLNFSLYVAVMR